MNRQSSRTCGRGADAPGFTLIELALIIVIIGLLAVVALSRFVDFSGNTRDAVEKGEVVAIRSGIRLYGAESQVKARTPTFPPSLDSAAPGTSSPSNPLFAQVLTMGMTDGRWSKASATRYASPSGRSFTYDPDAGAFLETGSQSYILTSGDGITVPSSYGRLSGSYAGSAMDILIPNSLNGFAVKSIWQDVFNGKGLTSVAFEGNSTVERIHARAFRNNSLTTIDFPDGLKRIDLYAFDSNQLTEVLLPSSLEIIEMRAFSGNAITRVTIGSGVSIGDSAFGNNNAFRDAYATGGQGTYSLINGAWIKSVEP